MRRRSSGGSVTFPGGPRPRDPRQVAVSADEVTRQFEAALSQDPADAGDEAEMLARAHAVLHDALRREPPH